MTPNHSTSAGLVAGLPPHLRERARALNEAPTNTAGEFVLYWMHHAVRDHENPALDAAIEIAASLSLPVLVYQGLGGGHRFDNDRHHVFILEGARDAHAALRRRGVSTAFALPPLSGERSPLKDLVSRSAVAVFEDFPAPPLSRWTLQIAHASQNAVVAVDACCIVPMQIVGRTFDRAFEFRRATVNEFAHRVPLSWPASTASATVFDGALGFEALDLDAIDPYALCGNLAIDHSIPPVPDTVGGSTAGYARWTTFRDEGLKGYARERNDAAVRWPHGVSRLSPYLHHGHVSPFKIAREAWLQGGQGSEKFLDELLVWRELAYNFCFHTVDPEVLSALPDWAQQTLQAHAGDPRPRQIDDESLARSDTPDELWNLAQCSLRIHGELHNNLRMTWAKAIPAWRPDPLAALQTLIELNHRFALDGSDPNSYGGLLWTLGLFDRPFEDAPITGRIRSRSTRAHARRLDVDRYRRRVTRPASGQTRRFAVIGAGISGLAAARALHDQGHRVSVFDKSRGVGGRVATRRIDGVGFDHGAQYFTVRDPRFERVVRAWRESGAVSLWLGPFARVAGGRVEDLPPESDRFVGMPGMSAIGKALRTGLDVRLQTRVGPPQWQSGVWQLASDQGELLGEFDALVLAVPAPQAVPLLEPVSPSLAAQAATVVYAPTWAVLLDLKEPLPIDASGLFFDRETLSWAARNAARPQRRGHGWVLHAAPGWARRHLDASADQVIERLCRAFEEASGRQLPEAREATAHRWLYALVERSLDTEALWDEERQLAVCGDWCLGARIEAAYLSGQAAAGHLLRHFAAEWK